MTDTSSARSDLRLAGVLAAASGLAALWACSLLFPRAPFAPSALGEIVLRLTPGGIATFFIETLGHWARRLLTAGAVTGALAAGTYALVLLRGPLRAALVLAPVALAATLASPSVAARPAPALAAALVAALAYGVVGRAVLDRVEDPAEEPDLVRRRAIVFGLGAAAGIVAGGGALGYVVRTLSGPDTDVDLVPPAAPVGTPGREGFPTIPELSDEITATADHYVVDINLVQPSLSAEGWRLRVHGEVERELSLSFEQLQRRFEVVEEFITLVCVSNSIGGDLIGNSAWGGVRLVDVLTAAGIADGAVDIVFHAADGYTDSIPVEVARDPAVLLAVSQNGRPLERTHGFPCRVRIPNIYGMKNVKWLEAIEVVDRDHIGYWQERGWSDVAIVKTHSRIDVAGRDHRTSPGLKTWIAGVAWAGDRGVSKVEVSTDGGTTWSEARLKEPASPYSWTQWAYEWTPSAAGKAAVQCRATDGTGVTQTAEHADPHPDGASGYHTVTVEVA